MWDDARPISALMRSGSVVVALLAALSACGAKTPLGAIDESSSGETETKPDARWRLIASMNLEALGLSDNGVSWRQDQSFTDGIAEVDLTDGITKVDVATFAKDDAGNIVLFNAEGRSFFSDDLGDHWTRAPSPRPVSISAP